MKAFLLILATVALVGRAALAADPAPTAAPSTASVNCVPGMTAPTPGVCSLPGFHWEHTTASVGTKSYDNSYDKAVWMLLPNK